MDIGVFRHETKQKVVAPLLSRNGVMPFPTLRHRLGKTGRQQRHRQDIRVSTVAKRVGSQETLTLEPRTFIEGDSTGIVREDGQLHPPDLQPVEGRIQQGVQQCTTDPLALKVVVNTESKNGDVLASPRLTVQPPDPDNLPVAFGHHRR